MRTARLGVRFTIHQNERIYQSQLTSKWGRDVQRRKSLQRHIGYRKRGFTFTWVAQSSVPKLVAFKATNLVTLYKALFGGYKISLSLSLSLWETYLLWYSIAPILKGAERNVFSSFFALFWLPYILQNVALDVSIRKKDFGFG